MERTRERGRGRGDEERGGRSRSDSDRGERGGRDEGRGRSSGGFKYQRRDPDSVKKRGDQGGGDYDKFLEDSVKMYKPHDGDNIIRILPPTWEGAEHFGLDIYVHYGIGADSQSYLCADKMKAEQCPICDERARAVKDGDQEYADKLKPVKRVLVYLIDRNEEKEGVIAWSMPWTIDRDLCKLVVDKRSGEVLPIDDPENGYDIEFERKGKGDRTQYIGLSIARRDSDLGNTKWLQFIQENPLPTVLHYYDYDHIVKAFGGKVEGFEDRGNPRKTDLDREQDAGLREVETRGNRDRSRNKDSELSWDSIHEMTFDELCSIIDGERLKIIPDESKNDEELADWICEDMNIQQKAKVSRRAAVEDTDTASKMDQMRSRRRAVE